jgi:predicted PurR-regulated permease PerM
MTLSASPGARARAAERWTALANRLRTITPEALARGLLALAVAAVMLWVAAASWPALAPFLIGAIIAYSVLPLAHRLSAFMPRVLAALLAELVALAILVGVLILVVPPLLRGLGQVASQLPTQADLQVGLADLQDRIGRLDEPVRGIVLAVTVETVTDLQAAMTQLVDGIGAFVSQQILGFLGTVSFVIGLLVIPAWVLTLVADERQLKRDAGRVLPAAIRPDVLALFRIVDRVLGTFIRIRVLLAIVVGVLIWFGLVLAREAGLGQFPYAVTAGTLLGTLQLIPELGFFLGFFPILLVLAVGGPVPALTTLIVYVAAARIASALVETRVSRGVLDVHPALLIPAIVAMSQFGLLWTLLAAPVVAILRDTVRYLAGRLADPPRPANVLPGERVVATRRMATVPVPSAYRSIARRRPTAAGTGTVERATTAPPPASSVPARPVTERSVV